MLFASTPKLAVLASGHGSNFEALALAERRGALGGKIVALLCDHPEAAVMERARRLGIEAQCPPAGRFRTRLEDEQAWVDALRQRDVDALLLAGFMRRLHAPLLDAYRDRIVNIHPSLLPAFPGLNAIARALEHGARVTGCTVHLVEGELDQGPIIAQTAVEVHGDDTLASLTERVHAAEHELYPAAVRRWLTEPSHREGRRLVFDAKEARHA
ncbi:MAG TPA: phosphoribosylglycinamide formyltransferase [Candidatus Udaeobacter sp.]|nr:phosphoribosylglycinamide formyltransferase [Candidatus Udaeobacter sp.]